MNEFCTFINSIMKINKVTYIFILFLSVSFVSLAQQQPLRIEFESNEGAEPYVAVPCGIYGALTFYPTLTKNENTVTWDFLLLDVNFKAVWSVSWPIGKELKFRHEERNDAIIYLAFTKSGKTKDEMNLQILRIDLKTGKFTEQTTVIEGRPQRSVMKTSLNAVVVGVEKSKGKANLLFLDFNTMNTSQLPFGLDQDNKLLSIDFDKSTNHYCFVSSNEPGKTTQSLECYFWQPLSNDFSQISIEGFGEYQMVNNAQYLNQGDSLSLIIGGYNEIHTSARNYDNDYGTPYTGLFSYNMKTDSLKFFPLSEFENIFKLITTQDIPQTRKQRKKGKPVDINLYLVFHNPVVYDDEIILLTESYYPQFHTVSSMAYDYYGRPLTTYYDVFDGFRYSNAIVCAFNCQGDITWTNQMDIRDVIVDRNKKISTLVKDNKYYVLAYAGIGNVASQVIYKNEIVDDITVTKVDYLYKRDRLMDSGTNTIAHWYGSYFMVYGYNTIRNSRITDTGKRNVFFINKMTYK